MSGGLASPLPRTARAAFCWATQASVVPRQGPRQKFSAIESKSAFLLGLVESRAVWASKGLSHGPGVGCSLALSVPPAQMGACGLDGDRGVSYPESWADPGCRPHFSSDKASIGRQDGNNRPGAFWSRFVCCGWLDCLQTPLLPCPAPFS